MKDTMLTNEQIDNSNISNDAKLVLKIISPVLTNMKTINEILENVVMDDKIHYKVSQNIKDILIGPIDKLSIGEGPSGIKGDINKIINLTKISKNLGNNDIDSIEDLLFHINNLNKIDSKILNEKIDKLNKILTEKPHWTKNVQGFKDIIYGIGIIITAMLTIYVTFFKG
jgi:hypothetical protein